ncbi:MAG: HupE/UreJ family protein [Rhodoferax sp.]|nr:HupE/UreJ family protein [Rhodoferax sp.]
MRLSHGLWGGQVLTSRVLRAALVWWLLAFGLAGAALAHKGSDAYLDIRQLQPAPQAGPSEAVPSRPEVPALRLSLSVALKDLDQVVAIDANGDARITWGEVRVATPALLAQLDRSARLDVAEKPDALTPTDADCVLRWQSDGLEQRSDGVYFRAAATVRCAGASSLHLQYRLFREQDAGHRLLVAGRMDGDDLLATISPQQDAAVQLRHATVRRAATGQWQTLRDYFLLGVEHLLHGYDHLAFLLALVLPLQLRLRPFSRVGHAAQPEPLMDNGWALLRTVTAFTLGHSITLVLATLGWTQADAGWVEPVIALSVAMTAALNLRPQPWLRVEALALVFGLVHGYGFAGLLVEAAAPDGLLPWALAGFNLGVEAGQLLAVAAWVLAVQWVVGRPWYQRVVVRGGSVLLIGLSMAWFWQRLA